MKRTNSTRFKRLNTTIYSRKSTTWPKRLLMNFQQNWRPIDSQKHPNLAR